MPTTRSILLDIEERRRGNALAGAANDMDKLAKETEKSENRFKLFEEDMKRVNTEIEKSTAKIKELRTQIARTGDTSLFGDLRKEEARLKSFETLARNLGRDVENAVENGVDHIPEATSRAISSGSPAIIAAIAALATAAAAPLGAIIAGSVVGLVGTGGIIGGVLAASQDHRVQEAFSQLGEQAKREFFGDGVSFVKPVVDALNSLGPTLHQLNLGKTFALAAPDLLVITHGLEDFAKNVMPGVNKVLERAGPFANVAARGFADLGSALSEFLDNVSKSPGALEGLNFGFKFISANIKAIGVGLKFLSDAFHVFNETGAGAFLILDKGLDAIGSHSDKIHNISQNLRELVGLSSEGTTPVAAFGGYLDHIGLAAGDAAGELEDAVKVLADFNQLVDDLIGNTLGVDEAMNRAQKTTKETLQTLVDNKGAWEGNSDAAIADREAVNNAIDAYNRLREAEIKNNVSAADANAEFEANVQALIALAGQSGVTKQALEDLAKKYIIQVELASSLPGIGREIAAQFQGALLNGGGLAAGGYAAPGTTHPVGEYGPERLTVLPGGGAVVTPMGGRMGGGQAVNVTIVLPGGGDIGSAVVAHLAKYAQVYGGGNVQLAITGRMN